MKTKAKIAFDYAVDIVALIVLMGVCVIVGAAIGYTDAWKEARAMEAAERAREAIINPYETPNNITVYPEESAAESRVEPVFIAAKTEYITPTEKDLTPTEKDIAPTGDDLPPVGQGLSEDDVFCLAAVIYQEAGGDFCSDDTRRMVADVVLNRVEDERFPDTVRGVLEDAPNGALQYGVFALTGVCFPAKADQECEKTAVMRAWDIAYGIAAGEHSELYGGGYVWQSEYVQSADSFCQDGIWFGR